MREIKKKDLIEYLLNEIDCLEPKDCYYEYYYNSLLHEEYLYNKDLITVIHEVFLKIKNKFVKYSILINNLIKQKINNFYQNKNEQQNEEENNETDNEEENNETDNEEENNETDNEEEEEEKYKKNFFKKIFIEKINNIETDIIKNFMDKELFSYNRETIENSLKRHIVYQYSKNTNENCKIN